MVDGFGWFLCIFCWIWLVFGGQSWVVAKVVVVVSQILGAVVIVCSGLMVLFYFFNGLTIFS